MDPSVKGLAALSGVQRSPTLKRMEEQWDVVIVGAGAAGLFCAGSAGALGLRVLLIEHGETVGEKIRISGGGRCNFTNRELDLGQAHRYFVGQNPRFCRYALSSFTPEDFIAMVREHGIAFHEKHKGQLFCDHSAKDIIAMLLKRCQQGGVVLRTSCKVGAVTHRDGAFALHTSAGGVRTPQLVVATGGLSIPKIGATGWGHDLALQFGIPLVARHPGLVPLTVDGGAWGACADLAGLSLPVLVETGEKKQRVQFHEDLLFTHKGLSGPAALQISSYWDRVSALDIDLCPGLDIAARLQAAKFSSRKQLPNELALHLPQRLAQSWVQHLGHDDAALLRSMPEVPDKALRTLCDRIKRWRIRPTGTEGYAKAEVTVGGIDTQALNPKTMASAHPGLYFIGEVVDITGWLGGYNFQWAWASAHVCAQALQRTT
jgi:predicted Rossmann fold flavoprotein